jgi:clan AA aspartic protease (TIGR02281 family)
MDLLARRGLPEQSMALRDALLEQARRWAAAGRQPLAEALLRDYVRRNPHDADGSLELSHVLQMRGLVEPAMDPLLEALRSADDPDAVARLRDALRLLVNVQEARLSGRQDVPGLIRFYEWLTAEDPGFDGHRMQLARWLLLAGRVDEAEAVLAQTGLSGVAPEARSDLEAEISLARSGLPVRWEDRAMHVEVLAGGRPLRLLVDTGASTTAVSRDAAAALGSQATGRAVRVRTAGGTVTAEVHQIRDLKVGELRVPTLEVLVLEEGPPGAAGLLGMDVLGRFPGLSGPGALPGGLLGRPAPSG